MKAFPQGKLRLDDKVLNENLGENNIIFVGSGTDMFADNVPTEWIGKVLNRCHESEMNRENTYLFQTKNPRRLLIFYQATHLPPFSIVGTTIETNRDSNLTAPITMLDRVLNLKLCFNFHRVITIEPIMDFDLQPFVELIKTANPKWVNIGADSKGHGLPEPSGDKIKGLICQLELFTEVKLKSNLKRLIK
jgi:protein gp37